LGRDEGSSLSTEALLDGVTGLGVRPGELLPKALHRVEPHVDVHAGPVELSDAGDLPSSDDAMNRTGSADGGGEGGRDGVTDGLCFRHDEEIRKGEEVGTVAGEGEFTPPLMLVVLDRGDPPGEQVVVVGCVELELGSMQQDSGIGFH
jgi:hypothetical protein